jgi:hypothetical protein
MNKKIILFLMFSIITTLSQAQKKIDYNISPSIYFSTSKENTKTYITEDNINTLHYSSSKPFHNPGFSLNTSATYSLLNKINVGIQSGIRLFIYETHFLNIKRTFVAIPLQGLLNYEYPLRKNSSIGIEIAPGFLFYKIDDFVYKIKNAFLLDAFAYYKFDKRHKVKIGIDILKEYASFDFKLNNSNTDEIFKFPVQRTSILLGYSYSLKKNKF